MFTITNCSSELLALINILSDVCDATDEDDSYAAIDAAKDAVVAQAKAEDYSADKLDALYYYLDG